VGTEAIFECMGTASALCGVPDPAELKDLAKNADIPSPILVPIPDAALVEGSTPLKPHQKKYIENSLPPEPAKARRLFVVPLLMGGRRTT
jgi:hypothetical protein